MKKLSLSLLLSAGCVAANAGFVPVPVTGFNADIVANGIGAPTTSTNASADAANYVFVAPSYQYNSGCALPSVSLPAPGAMVPGLSSTPGLTFQLADYSQNNSLRIATTGGSAAFTVTTPLAASTVYLAAVSGSGAGTVTVDITFTDATVQTLTGVSVPDWYGAANFILTQQGRVATTVTGCGIETTPTTGPRIYQIPLAIAAANQSKLIASIAITRTSTAGVINVMAVSANQIDPCTAPTSIFATVNPTAVCLGGSVTITVDSTQGGSAATAYEYQFVDGSGTIVQAYGNSNSFTTTANATGNNSYTVFVKDAACSTAINPIPATVQFYAGLTATLSSTNPLTCNDSGTILFTPTSVIPWYTNDFTSATLDPTQAALVGNNSSITGGRAVLTPSATGNSGGIQILNPAAINQNALHVSYDMTADLPINNFGTGGADGIAWSYSDNGAFGGANPQNGFGNKLRISFDAANNQTQNGNVSGIYLVYGYTNSTTAYGPATTGVLAYSPDLSWKLATDLPIDINISAAGKLTLTVNNVVIFDQIQLPASYLTENKSTWKHLFSATTGGDALRQAIDNINIESSPAFEYSITSTNGTNGTWQADREFTSVPGGMYTGYVRFAANPSCFFLAGTATLTIVGGPMPTVISANPTVCQGVATTIGFTAASGYTYAFLPNNAGISDTSSFNPTVTITAPQVFDVLVTDPANNCTSTVSISVTVDSLPVITSQPLAQTLCEGSPLSLNIVANHAATYQFSLNGGAVGTASATGNYSVASVTQADAGNYTVQVAGLGACASQTAISSPIAIGVDARPVFTMQPQGVTVCEGQPINLAGNATGASAFQYALNGTPQGFAGPDNTLSIAQAAVSDAGTYTLLAYGSGACSTVPTTSADALVTVNPLSFTLPANNATVTLTMANGEAAGFLNSNCEIILQFEDGAGGNAPGLATATAKVDATVSTFLGSPYLQRHPDLQIANPADGTVNFAVGQSEFDAYNAVAAPLGLPLMPTGPADAAGIANVKVTHYHGAPGAATSGPGGMYNVSDKEISNSTSATFTMGFWIVSVPVQNASGGYFVHTGDGALTVADQAPQIGLRTYPNPVSGMLHVQADGAQQDASIRLTDVAGKTLYTAEMPGSSLEIDMSNFAGGLYFVEYSSAAHHATLRVNKK